MRMTTRKIVCGTVVVLLSSFAFCCYLLVSPITSVNTTTSSQSHRRLEENSKQRILYIVTSVAEYDTGRRKTVEGRDRFAETLVPVVAESAESMLASGYDVDVYLISHYTLLPERRALLQRSLPSTVHLQVWDDATPLSYVRPKEGDTGYVMNITRALARQHRYVIKDKLLDYDLFVAFEDDMLIHGTHVKQYVKVSHEIERLKQDAPLHIPNPSITQEQALNSFHGPMSRMQLSRVIPGFIRVEVAKNATNLRKRTRPGKIPADPVATINPLSCCERPSEPSPSSQDLFLWETHIRALGIRKMPQPPSASASSPLLEWVLLQRGGNPFGLEAEILIGDYWAGRDGDFNVTGIASEDSRPPPMESVYANNQGGYMATRQQIWQWHTRTCLGGFLPPFYEPSYPKDGMNHVVEYWSGGGNLVGRLACHLQRIIPLEPEEFSKHLLYHTSNNKQKQLKFVRAIFSQADTLLGQLHTARKRAEEAIHSAGIIRGG